MNSAWDFILFLGVDLSMYILMCLDDPSDLARVCLVSSSWCHFVIEKGLFKSLFLKLFPDISSITRIIEEKYISVPVEIRPGNSSTWETKERDHKVYSSLCRGLSFVREDCISQSISAPSANNFQSTSRASDRVYVGLSYWSGEGNPPVLKAQIYQLISRFCVITEVDIELFQERLHSGVPISSAKAVRFRLGHHNTMPAESDSIIVRNAMDDFFWTYTSPIFPMAQENGLQKFKLPEPVPCIGGYLAVELLDVVHGRGGFYFLSFVNIQVVGRSLSPAFNVNIINQSGSFTLKYNQSAAQQLLPAHESQTEATPSSSGDGSRNVARRFRLGSRVHRFGVRRRYYY